MRDGEVRLYVIADRGVFTSDEAWLGAIAAVAPAVATSAVAQLQVRVKGLPPGERCALIRRAAEILGGDAGQAILNGSVDEALAHGYGGAHYPEAALPDAIPATPAGFTVGTSVHSLPALERATRAGADFVLFGPVFDAGSKPVAGAGLEALREVSSTSTLPVLAVGGITPERVEECARAGGSGVAVVTGIFLAADPAAAVCAYARACENSRAVPAAGLQASAGRTENAFSRGEKS